MGHFGFFNPVPSPAVAQDVFDEVLGIWIAAAVPVVQAVVKPFYFGIQRGAVRFGAESKPSVVGQAGSGSQ
jgi:hypothetical protein